jgi:hypothetical protein
MRFFNLRLILAGVWLAVALGLFFREQLVSADVLARYEGRNLTLGGWLALLLAGWNVARWYQTEAARARRTVSERKPIQPRREAAGGYEYNPEFDFQKMEREGEGERPAT